MSVNEIPPALANIFGLGPVQSLYPVRKSRKWGSAIAGLVFLGLAAAVFIFGLWNAHQQTQKFGPAVLLKNLWPPVLIAGFLFLLALLASWSAYRNWNKVAAVYQNGLAYVDHKGVRSWRWDEIASLTSAVTRHYTNGIYTGTTHVYTLFKNDGSKLILDDAISNVEALSNAIRASIYPRLYKEYAEAYNAGRRLTFGPVSLSKGEGIQVGKKTYPWDQVGQVSIHQGVLRVAKKGGGWFSGASAMASTIPNLEVLLSIIDQVVGVKAG